MDNSSNKRVRLEPNYAPTLPKVPKMQNQSIDAGNTCRFTIDHTKLDKPFPYFRKPSEIGSFSQHWEDQKRVFHHDRSQLKFYIKPSQPELCFNLRAGYGSFVRKDEAVKEYLNDMLKWVMLNREKFALQTEDNTTIKSIESLNTDFLCWRGLLTRFLCTPYEKRDDWKVAITKFRGTYFMCEFETEKKKQEKAQMTPRQDEMTYWGLKFEQYVTAGTAQGKPDLQPAVNNNEGFCSVVRSRLDAHSLVFGGEVDCIDPSMEGGNQYLELKTSRHIQTNRQDENFKRFKLIKWWAQSFLLGLTKIIAGFRDDDGTVHSLQEYPTLQIPSMVKGISNEWRPNVCFNFLSQLLTFIKNTVTVDDPRTVYLMSWSPGSEVLLEPLGRDSTYVFLPPWFIEWEAWTHHG